MNDPGEYGFIPPHPNVFKAYFLGEGSLNSKAVFEILDRLKQSHTAYIVNDRIETEFDNRNLEKFVCCNISSFMKVIFFAWYVLDGTWLLDGSVCLNNSIPLKLGIGYGVKMICEERVDSDTEIFMYGTVSNEVKVPISIIGTAIREDEDADAATVTTFAVNVEETIDTFLIQRKNLWYLDGEYVLNGTKLLNAKKIEEAI